MVIGDKKSPLLVQKLPCTGNLAGPHSFDDHHRCSAKNRGLKLNTRPHIGDQDPCCPHFPRKPHHYVVAPQRGGIVGNEIVSRAMVSDVTRMRAVEKNNRVVTNLSAGAPRENTTLLENGLNNVDCTI